VLIDIIKSGHRRIASRKPLIYLCILIITQVGEAMRHTQKHPQHRYLKRDVYYFSRVVPRDIKHHYIKARIIQSLKTKSAHHTGVMVGPKRRDKKPTGD